MTGYSFYLVSTPLHLFLSSALALRNTSGRNVLIFIDQADTLDNFYLKQINAWQDSPFEQVHIFPGRIKGLLEKRRSRKQIVQQLAKLVEQYQPENVYVGNDRRIEFQYCMHATQQYGGARGIYIDEGTYTYFGRPDSLRWQDRIADNLVKKMTYGSWWQNPPTIGGSAWIKQVYAAFPEKVHALLQGKEVTELPAEWLQHPALQKLSAQLLQTQDIKDTELSDVDVFIALPHESVMQKDPDYKESVLSLINELHKQQRTVAIKYHPRDTAADALNLAATPCKIIPAKVNFEALLLIFPQNMKIIGDFSSVLLNARWLRPDLEVMAVIADINNANPLLVNLYQELSIRMLKTQDIQSVEF